MAAYGTNGFIVSFTQPAKYAIPKLSISYSSQAWNETRKFKTLVFVFILFEFSLSQLHEIQIL